MNDTVNKNSAQAPKYIEGGHKRWAIQIVTHPVRNWQDSKIQRILGKSQLEHSYTRLAQIWCDENNNALRDPTSGELYPAIEVRGILDAFACSYIDGEGKVPNLGKLALQAITPKKLDGLIDNFINKANPDKPYEIYRQWLGVDSVYGEDFEYFEPRTACNVQDPPVFIGGQECIERMWLIYQERALAFLMTGMDYDVLGYTCHRFTSYLNAIDKDAVTKFANGGIFRWGAGQKSPIKVPLESSYILKSLKDIKDLNAWISYKIYANRHGIDLNENNDAEVEKEYEDPKEDLAIEPQAIPA